MSRAYTKRLAECSQPIMRVRRLGPNPYEREITECQGMNVTVHGKRMINMSSYSYLGFCANREIYGAAHELARPFLLGTGGTRVVCGTTTLHCDLERELASFLGTESALLIPSGFSANATLISALAEPTDHIIADECVHASLKDGLRLARTGTSYFRHNDLSHLLTLLGQPCSGIRWVVIDGVYSMDGDVARLDEIRAICNEYDACLYTDDAHGLGVLGATGAGVYEHFALKPGPTDLLMGTISKAIPSIGGFVAGPNSLRDALLGSCRGYIFSSATPPFDVAVALLCLRKLRASPHLTIELNDKIQFYCRELESSGMTISKPDAAIVPLPCKDSSMAIQVTHACEAQGVYVLPAIYPVVPLDGARIRTTVTNGITKDDLRIAAHVIAETMLRALRPK